MTLSMARYTNTPVTTQIINTLNKAPSTSANKYYAWHLKIYTTLMNGKYFEIQDAHILAWITDAWMCPEQNSAPEKKG